MKRSSTRMKKLKTSFLILFFTAAMFGCDTKTTEKTEETPDSTVIEAPAENELNSDQSALLETIIGTNNTEGSILRGISFGDPVSKIKALESFEMFEEMADHLGYTAETPQLETIDVQYFLTPDKKVNRITVDVYLNSAEATKQLWNAGKKHFTENYDAPKEETSKVTWNKNSIRINMEDVSKGKDFGLKFQFVPTNKNVLAAK
jgi:uncharacterized membrane protein YfhO